MRKLLSIMLASLMVLSLSVAAGATGAGDYAAVIGTTNLAVPQTLNITRPGSNVSTTASSYYLTGTSDPSQPLYMNGYEVTTRGAKGSFGVFVNLAYGQNYCTFTQGDVSKSVTITRNETGGYTTTTTLSSMYPTMNTAVRSGESMKITVVAPAGASVSATLNGQTIQLSQNVAAAVSGVPANFSGTMTASTASGIQNIGKVTYTLTFGGNTTTHTSAGSVYLAAQGQPIVVQVTDQKVNLFASDSTYSNFVTVLDYGMIDTVTDIGDNLYKLAMGGWVSKSSVSILPDRSSSANTFSAVSFNREGREEQYLFTGTSFPGYTTHETTDKFYISFANTSGLSSVPVADSALFSACTVTRGEDGYTVLEFTKKLGVSPWGYIVEYKDGGITQLSLRYKPTLGGGDQPLAGITVLVDAGHGGTDPGALGTAYTSGPTEAQITLATSYALQRKLESMGATVIMARTGDDDITMNRRLQIGESNRVDFFLSLHCNAIGGNGIGKKGVEVYYYEDIASSLASNLSANIASSTSRTNRGAKFSNFRVTLGSFAPSVLIEMGFLTDPTEYDQMIDNGQIYNTVTAIANTLVNQLR